MFTASESVCPRGLAWLDHPVNQKLLIRLLQEFTANNQGVDFSAESYLRILHALPTGGSVLRPRCLMRQHLCAAAVRPTRVRPTFSPGSPTRREEEHRMAARGQKLRSVHTACSQQVSQWLVQGGGCWVIWQCFNRVKRWPAVVKLIGSLQRSVLVWKMATFSEWIQFQLKFFFSF